MSPKKPTKGKPNKAKASKAKSAKSRAAGGRKPAAKKRKNSAVSAKRTAKMKRRAAKRIPAKRRSFKRWLISEVLLWSTGIIIGLAVVGNGLWNRAIDDVATWIESPPNGTPSLVLSSPWQLHNGQRVSTTELTQDLLSANYQRLQQPQGEPMAFSEQRGAFTVSDQSGETTSFSVSNSIVVSAPSGGTPLLAPVTLATVGDASRRRTRLQLDAIAPIVPKAVLAMEDSRFHDHHGIDPLGIARALVHNLFSDSAKHGGSTLTQQLAKNLFLSADRTYRRKVREVFFAAALEANLSKEEILELYLAEVYLGQSGGQPVYGVERAARVWFGVSADKLNLKQAAAIAGTIASPNRYSPARHPERSSKRREIVLKRMLETQQISKKQATEAAGPLETRASSSITRQRAPWAVDMAIDDTQSHLGALPFSDSGITLHTSIDPALQRAAEWAVSEGMAELDNSYPKANGAQVGLAAVRISDGAIVAIVGGRDYQTSQFNRATRAWRSPGSLVKPITLLAAFDEDKALSPISTILDEPITRENDGTTWTPKNYDGKYHGDVTLRQVIEASINIPSVKLAETVGPVRLKRQLNRMGISRASTLPSTALGAFESTALEMAGAYAAFPNGGTHNPPNILRGIRSAQGTLIYEHSPTPRKVASERAAALATSVLHGVITQGTGTRAARYGARGNIGGKTGTTNGYRDAWFAGFTPEIAVAVWVGRDRDGSIGLSGSRAALPTWARFIKASGSMNQPIQWPKNVMKIPVCKESLQPARSSCESTYEEFVSTETKPDPSCKLHGGLLDEISEGLGGLFPWGRKQNQNK
jgi:penicillin-binding protein 1B